MSAFYNIYLRISRMKVSLPNTKANCRLYGLEFDLEGVSECEQEVAQSLIDAGKLIEIKPEKKSKK
tara:strand:+ start:982 stop:1179 length:198 start_codon:yes stop_codon:yes gene_type:complete